MAEVTRVALVRSDRRRGGIAQALNLIADDLRRVVTPDVLLKPNFVCQTRQLPSTHPEAMAATLDALFASGAQNVKIAEGASDATAAYKALGHEAECAGRPVTFFDINKQETSWDIMRLRSVDGSPLETRVSRTITSATCRVSLALMKTHVTPSLTMSLKNMLSSIHPQDRVRMHGYAGGNGATGWKRPIIEFLKGDTAFVTLLTRLQGRVRRLINLTLGKYGASGWDRLSPADMAFLKSVAAMHQNLVTLTENVKPHISVLDGFVAMHREGPKHGTPIKLGLAIAGTDPVAVDAVGAAAMGFDPMRIGYLKLAHDAGLGNAELSRIEIVGDSLASVSRKCVAHSNDAVQRHWARYLASNSTGIPTPHFALAKAKRQHPK